MLPVPINFQKWVEENYDKLQPPVNNFLLFKGNDTTVMVVGGPNQRTDYHINETEEYFYQVKGDLLIKLVVNSEFKDLWVREGEMFLLPGNTPHNPVRFANTVGLVLERARLPHHIDTLRWYCENEKCRSIVYQESFHCTDLGTQLKPIIERFANNEELRKCKQCGTLNHTNLYLVHQCSLSPRALLRVRIIRYVQGFGRTRYDIEWNRHVVYSIL
ncbi:hypothetical protein VTP01DRAFT_7634 [Rhizomucor pusillus]|uniref:uncharacterized protein n=1 Tax=Rhizomucor pusillus TaxID=4840 RepID=UPI003742038E